MSYVDLDPLSAFSTIPSTWLAQLLANTEALHDGTGFANDAVPAQAINFGGAGSGVWWEEIARTTLGSAGDTITVSSIPARKHLRAQVLCIPTGGSIRIALRLNNDSSANYVSISSENNGVVAGAGGQTILNITAAAQTNVMTAELRLINVSGSEKLIIGEGVDAGVAGTSNGAQFRNNYHKWVNTSTQINRIDISNSGGSGDFAIGSEIVVLGHD